MLGIAAANAAPVPSGQTIDQELEVLDWTDPERAALMIDTATIAQQERAPEFELLEVRGMVYADNQRDSDVEAILKRLHGSAVQGDAAAAVAEHYVRGYTLYERNQYAAADAELTAIDLTSIETDSERYRVCILRGEVLLMQGQAESALPFLEHSLDLAQELHDDPRRLHAMLSLARIYTHTSNLDRAAAQLASAEELAQSLGDEAALSDIEACMSDVEDRRGDRAAERRASLAALEHAKRSHSSQSLGNALLNLGDSYLKTHDYKESLRYSKMALPIIQKLRESRAEPIIEFNEGLAYIALGKIKPGEALAESAIAAALAGDNMLDGKELLREYADALEQAGYLMMAIQVYHRYDKISDELFNSVRERAFLELSAKFDDERRARELELLRRENALRVSENQSQRLRAQVITAGALCVTLICAALVWAFARVRKANQKLLISSERDALTGLRNRRYFNERVLTVDGARPASGCVLLADLDHFKRINDTLGHPAGDAVLAMVSNRLSAALRVTDTLVRWGGEEFLAVLDPCTPEQATATVERLLDAVRQDPVVWNGQSVPCTISVGYAYFPMEGAATEISLESAVSLVDKALYEAKRRGRDRACLITVVNAHDKYELTRISTEFERAAEDRRIELREIGVAA